MINKTEGGFLKIIIIILVAFILMKYLHITFYDIFNWIKTLFNSVL